MIRRREHTSRTRQTLTTSRLSTDKWVPFQVPLAFLLLLLSLSFSLSLSLAPPLSSALFSSAHFSSSIPYALLLFKFLLLFVFFLLCFWVSSAAAATTPSSSLQRWRRIKTTTTTYSTTIFSIKKKSTPQLLLRVSCAFFFKPQATLMGFDIWMLRSRHLLWRWWIQTPDQISRDAFLNREYADTLFVVLIFFVQIYYSDWSGRSLRWHASLGAHIQHVFFFVSLQEEEEEEEEGSLLFSHAAPSSLSNFPKARFILPSPSTAEDKTRREKVTYKTSRALS